MVADLPLKMRYGECLAYLVITPIGPDMPLVIQIWAGGPRNGPAVGLGLSAIADKWCIDPSIGALGTVLAPLGLLTKGWLLTVANGAIV